MPAAADELRLEYQPIIDLKTDRLVGAEALVRWEHPAMGRISPGTVHPARRRDRPDRRRRRMGRRAGMCRSRPAPRPGTGRRRLHRQGQRFGATVHQRGDPRHEHPRRARSVRADAANLRFELTESVPLTQIPDAANRIRQLTNYGFGLAIDDFGTGYSSLGLSHDVAVRRPEARSQPHRPTRAGSRRTGRRRQPDPNVRSRWASRSSPKASRPTSSRRCSATPVSSSGRGTSSAARYRSTQLIDTARSRSAPYPTQALTLTFAGIHRPVVFGVTASHVLADLGPAAIPETRQIRGALDRASCRRQQFHSQRLVTIENRWMRAHAIEVLCS